MCKNVQLLLTGSFTVFYFKISNNVKGHKVYHNRTKFKKDYETLYQQKVIFQTLMYLKKILREYDKTDY